MARSRAHQRCACRREDASGGRDFCVPASLTRHARSRPGRRPRSATRVKTALRLPDGVAAATDMGMGSFRLDAAPQRAIAL
jgi:hypothetical protein